MGVQSSPLRDSVVFVEGAPRSGTTWLVTLLATHAEIAGTQAESHLFDFGIDRLFDNLEYRHEHLHGLERYLTREELVDLVRDLCDGVFEAMRAHVGGGRLVVEKTPVGARTDGLDLARKRDVYPDARYIHVVRDREAVARSLMAAPFMADNSYETCAGLWDRAVGSIREHLGDLPGYREVGYDALRADPAAMCRELFEWLGVAAGEEALERVRAVSQERFSDLGAVAPPERRPLRRRIAARLRRQRPPAGGVLVLELVKALRAGDADALEPLTHPRLELEFRSPVGDGLHAGDDARAALMRLSDQVFNQRHAGEWWAASGGAGEFFTQVAGHPFWSLFYWRIGGDATRVDVALGITIADELIRRVVVLSAGPLSGRPLVSGDGALAR